MVSPEMTLGKGHTSALLFDFLCKGEIPTTVQPWAGEGKVLYSPGRQIIKTSISLTSKW